MAWDNWEECHRCGREKDATGCPEHEFKTGTCDNCGDPTYCSQVMSFDVCSQSCENELLRNGDAELKEDVDLPNPSDRSSQDPVRTAEKSERKTQKELF